MQFAFSSQNHFEFIVAAESVETLAAEIDRIIERHPGYAKARIRPGIYITEGTGLSEAKRRVIREAGKTLRPTFIDLNLFRQRAEVAV